MKISSCKNGFLLQVVKGVTLAVLITLVSVLVFAFLLSVFDISDKVIKPINQFIKTYAIFLACFLSVKDSLFIIKGGLIGLLSAIFTILIFALISSVSFSFLAFLIDALFGLIIGVVASAIVYKLSCW